MGKSVESPTVANFSQPGSSVPMQTEQGPMMVDMAHVTELLAERGIEMGKGDVLSIRGFRNAAGKLVPDYDSIQVEKRKDQHE